MLVYILASNHFLQLKNVFSMFDFIGYTFKVVFIMCKDNKVRHNFIALVSNASSKNFRDKVKAMETHKKLDAKSTS